MPTKQNTAYELIRNITARDLEDRLMRVNFLAELYLRHDEAAMAELAEHFGEDSSGEVAQWYLTYDSKIARALSITGHIVIECPDGYLWGRTGCGYIILGDLASPVMYLQAMCARALGVEYEQYLPEWMAKVAAGVDTPSGTLGLDLEDGEWTLDGVRVAPVRYWSAELAENDEFEKLAERLQAK